MKLSEDKWANYSTKSVDTNKKNEYSRVHYPDLCELRTASLGEMKEKLEWMIHSAEMNHKDIYDIPFFIKYDNKLHVVETVSCGHGNKGMICSLAIDPWDELKFTAPDSRPEGGGEFWNSRGPSDLDCSGFVVSKPAGERLRRMVNYVLEKDKTKSWLDFRELGPSWIQYKFSTEEFDVEKLDKMARENKDVITEAILRECVKEK